MWKYIYIYINIFMKKSKGKEERKLTKDLVLSPTSGAEAGTLEVGKVEENIQMKMLLRHIKQRDKTGGMGDAFFLAVMIKLLEHFLLLDPRKGGVEEAMKFLNELQPSEEKGFAREPSAGQYRHFAGAYLSPTLVPTHRLLHKELCELVKSNIRDVDKIRGLEQLLSQPANVAV